MPLPKDLDASPLGFLIFAHELHHKTFLFFRVSDPVKTAPPDTIKIEILSRLLLRAKKILSILNYLNEHLTESISIDDLSSRFLLKPLLSHAHI